MQPSQRLLSAIALVACSASTFAATTVYTTSASFLANVLPGSYTETFNGLSGPPAGPAAFAAGGFAYSVSADGDLYASGAFLGTSLPNKALTVTFTSGNVTAVGGNVYATDLSDNFLAVSMTLTLSDGTVTFFTPTSAADSFRGFTSTATLTSLVISAPGVSRYAGLDSLTVGASAVPVPEPAAWLLMGLGLAGVFVARRRSA